MKTTKAITSLGIWMDHSVAHLIEFNNAEMVSKKIEAKSSNGANKHGSHKGENSMNQKENHQQAEFYKILGTEILKYDRLILFGPTDAKLELFHLLSLDHHFDKIIIELKQTDKMTENQEHAFVRDYFSKHSNV